MEQVYEIFKFLPKKIDEPWLSNYIDDNIKKLIKSLENWIETWIYFHTHILFMIYIYIQLLRISQFKKQEFKFSLVWLTQDDKHFLDEIWEVKDDFSAFEFSKINERTVFRFFRLIWFDNWFIGNLQKCIWDRNNVLHASWNTISEVEDKIDFYLKNMQKISEKSKDFILDCYENFTQKNEILLEDWFKITEDDLENTLYIPYYFSDFDLQNIVKWKKNWKVIDYLKTKIDI